MLVQVPLEAKMTKKILFTVYILICTVFATSCRAAQASPSPQANMPNPASVYCEQNGGTLKIVTGSDGSQSGVCTFPDGSTCDEWAYFHGECKPGDSLGEPVPEITTTASMPTPTVSITGGGSGQIVFYSNRDGGYNHVYLLGIGDASLTQLTQGEANSFSGPFSPNGKQILFTGFGLTHSYIGLMDADGGNPVDLTKQSDSDEAFPAWSPDGTHIAFTSRRDGNNEIYVMNADGSNQRRLTDSPKDDFAPAWSPDGTKIAFVSDRDNQTGTYSLYVMNADGTTVTRLTNDNGSDYSPDWSPDGQWIAYHSFHDGQADVYIINVESRIERNLTRTPTDDYAPRWSPDGSRIAFQSKRDGNWEVYLMDPDGANLINLTNDPADDQMPFWKP